MQFHVATINGLPQVYLYGVSLSILAFTALLIPAFYFLIRFRFQLRLIHLPMVKIVLAAWFILCSFYFFQRLLQAQAEHVAFSGRSLEEMRELTTTGDYYGFIEFIKRYVPQDEGVLLFLPEGADYFNQKTEYYLYPWRIAHNGRYLAVFHTKVPLEGAKLLAEYKKGEELYYKTD